MKAFLMHRERDFDFDQALPAHAQTLSQDLELDTLWTAMAAGDQFLFEVSRRALLASLADPDAIAYRQGVLADALQNPAVVRELYALANAALQAEKRVWGGLYRESPHLMLSTFVGKMEVLVGFLRRLRALADEHAAGFASTGFARFFSMLCEELDETYFELIEGHIKALKFKGGMLMSAHLGSGNRGEEYVLRQPHEQGLLGRVFDRSGYSFTIPDRDESGFKALARIEDRGANLVANALGQSVEHVLSFFVMLRSEVGFYVACINLQERLAQRGEPIGYPTALPRDEVALSASALYDVCLSLTSDRDVVGNDVRADGRALVVITGANQGGKSTFLRGVGLAQLMMQCGMFVGAESFHANVCDGLFSHYKREEDATMESGKLDEELSRMSDIIDHIGAGSMLLCNESFAATNEREGSEIARRVVRALLDERIKVLFVTHMYDLADGLYAEKSPTALFLRAERAADGTRPFKLTEGPPLPTSYGEDSYRRVFGRAIELESPMEFQC